MKKQLFLAATLLATFFTAKAQKPDTAQLLAHYKFTHVRDTADRTHPYTENMVLLVGKSASAYKSYDGIQDAIAVRKQIEEQKANSPDGNISIHHRSTASRTQYYQFPNEQKLFTVDGLLMNSYLMEDPIPAIDWKISSDTATFGGLHCQKATTRFKGRDYTAWFCPDLPVHAGPWKLNGLPGVVVDAHDSKNDVVFKFDGVEKAIPSPPKSSAASNPNPDGRQHTVMIGMDDSDADPNLIAPPAKAIKTTQKEFAKLKEAMRKDPQAFADAIMNSQNANMPGNHDKMMIKVKAGPEPVNNNPIELPEKK
ncbi:MAG TPA: GLPGLI family protein [Mucilaginibacter sp.]